MRPAAPETIPIGQQVAWDAITGAAPPGVLQPIDALALFAVSSCLESWWEGLRYPGREEIVDEMLAEFLIPEHERERLMRMGPPR